MVMVTIFQVLNFSKDSVVCSHTAWLLKLQNCYTHRKCIVARLFLKRARFQWSQIPGMLTPFQSLVLTFFLVSDFYCQFFCCERKGVLCTSENQRVRWKIGRIGVQGRDSRITAIDSKRTVTIIEEARDKGWNRFTSRVWCRS